MNKDLNLIKPFLTLSVLGATSRIFGFLSIMLLVRILEPKEYGQYVYFVALLAVGSQLLDFRVYQTLVREFNNSSYSDTKKASLVEANLLLEILCGVLAATLLMSFYFLSEGIPKSSSEILLPLIFLGIGTISQYFLRGMMNGFHSVNKMLFYGLSDALPQLLFFSSVILFYFLSETLANNGNTAFILKSVSFLLSSIMLLYYFYKLLNTGYNFRSDILQYSRSLISMSIFPLMTGWLSIIYYQADRVMLKWLRDDASEIGILHNAVLLGILITFFTTTFSKVLYPNLAEMFDKKGVDAVKPIVDRYNEFFFQVILPACLALHFFSKPLITLLFGEAYVESAPLYSIWILFVAFTVSLGPGLHLLYLSKQQHFLTIGMAMGAFINIVLNIILIPEHGPLGAIYATGAGTLLNIGYAHYRVSKTILYEPLRQARSKIFLSICIIAFFLGHNDELSTLFGIFMIIVFLYGSLKLFRSVLSERISKLV